MSEAEPVGCGELIDGLDDLARRMPVGADMLLISEAIGLIQSLAKPASEPAGVDVREAKTREVAELIERLQAAAEITGDDLLQDAITVIQVQAAALSSSAGPAVEAVAWRYRLFRETSKWTYETRKTEVDCRRNANYEIEPLYAHPAPATVEMREALLAKAREQVDYWNNRQRNEKALEDATDDAGNYSPLGDGVAWSSGYCNGRYSEADWWLKTIAALAPATERRPTWLGQSVQELIADPGASVTITGRSVAVQAQWTGWAIKRFDGGSLAASMREAVACRAHYRRAHPND